MGYLASYRTKATEFNPMTTQRWLIWSIHDRGWSTNSDPEVYTSDINKAYRYKLGDAALILSQSNFRTGNVPNEAMVPEPKNIL